MHLFTAKGRSGSTDPNDLTTDPPSYDASVASSDSQVTPPSTPSVHPSTRPSVSTINSRTNPRLHKQNVPYSPLKEQQKQIDLLNKNATTVLSATTSGAHTEYFDVLPSFQMFQSILKRDDNQFNENLRVNPPTYGDTLHSSPTPPRTPGPSSVQTPPNTEEMVNSITERLNQYDIEEEEEDEDPDYLFSDNEEEEGSQQHPHQDVNDPHDAYSHSVLDNIDKLAKLHTSPIDIQIFVVKGVPQAHAPSEMETRLKEYTSGDLVNGYIVITNKSDKPVDFGLFTVSLEGTIKAVERDPSASSELTFRKFKKVLIKKFLKMYDLNASYGYTHIPNSAGIEYEAYTVDSNDGCHLGLPNERILQPQVKYKKFFTFRFPEKLLDNNCIDNLLPHNLPPPSVGLDRTCFYNRGDTVALNKALGYGFLNIRGTPLLTRDYAFDDVSISYTIEAKFIDKVDSDRQSKPLSQHEINDPGNESNYVISKHNNYFLRFIPDLREQIEYFNSGYDILTSTYSSLGIDGKLYQDYLQMATWRAMNEHNSQLEKEIDARLSRVELSETEIKHKNLLLNNKEYTSNINSTLDTKERIARQLHFDRGSSWLVDEMLAYQDRRMICNPDPIDVFGKKKKKILSSLVKIGELRLYVRVPDKILPYSSPKLLMKYNNTPTASVEDLAGTGFHSVSDDLGLMPISSVSSVSSNNMNYIYNRNEQETLLSVDVELVFVTSSGSKPPPLSSIELNLVFWSFKTDYPLPIELSYDFFYTSGENAHQSSNDVQITSENLQIIKDKVTNYIQFLKANKTFVSKSSYLYLKAMKALGIKKDTIKEYFKSITPSSDLLSDAGWDVHQTPDQKFKWTKHLCVPLTVVNKNNITLLPTFQSCLYGRLYCLQVAVKYKGGSSDNNEFADNLVKVDVPILVG